MCSTAGDAASAPAAGPVAGDAGPPGAPMASAAKAAMLPAGHQRRPARIAVLPCRSPRCDPATCSTRKTEILRRKSGMSVPRRRERAHRRAAPGLDARVLLGVLGGAGLADDGDADLAGVGQLFLDLLGDVARDDLGGDVVDLVGLDHHPDLAARLHREHLLDAGLLARDLLDPLEPLHILLERLPPRPGASAAPPVG